MGGSLELEVDNLGWFGEVVKAAKAHASTDIYILEGKPVRLGLLKGYFPIEPAYMPSGDEIVELMDQTIPALPMMASQKQGLDGKTFSKETSIYAKMQSGGVEYCFAIVDYGRFRVSCTKSEEGIGMSIRKLPYFIPDFDELNKQGHLDGIGKLLNFQSRPPSGLILHAGMTGSGKTTLISSEVDRVASRSDGVVLTFENPIEYRYTFRKALVRQYEVGRHVDSYVSALRMALRNDPSVIVLGEVRTKDEIIALIDTAVRGHLVLSTVHTSSVLNTLRFLDGIGENQDSWRQMVAGCLLAIVAQKLIHKEGVGFIVMPEVLIPNAVVRQKISEGKFLEVQNMLVGNELAQEGCTTFGKVLEDLAKRNYIRERERAEIMRTA